MHNNMDDDQINSLPTELQREAFTEIKEWPTTKSGLIESKRQIEVSLQN